jgi:hypothetical protein
MTAVPSLSGLVPTRFHFTFSICQGNAHAAEVALKMGALQFSYVKPWGWAQLEEGCF